MSNQKISNQPVAHHVGVRKHLGFQAAPQLRKVSLVLAGQPAFLRLELPQLAEQLAARQVEVRDLRCSVLEVDAPGAAINIAVRQV